MAQRGGHREGGGGPAGRGAGRGRGPDRAPRLGVVLPLLLGQLLALMNGGSAFYLEVLGLEKCFIQEMPDGIVVIGADTASRAALPAPHLES